MEQSEFSGDFRCDMGSVRLILSSSINIHLLNLLNGSPHEVPRKKVLPLDLGKNGGASVTSMQISSSRIALVVDFWKHNVVEQHKELIVWDWRTGNMVGDLFFCRRLVLAKAPQVFRRSNNRPDLGGAISGITTIEFLEGTWLLAVSHNPDPQLLIIDTLVPKQYRRSWQILKLPPLTARGGAYSISTQCENSLARYPEFSVDPAQRNFAVFSKKGWTLVVPAELLKRCLNSVRANRHIWWDDWKKHVTAIYLPDTVTVRIVDMKALVLRGSGNFPENWGVEMYDLSKSAQKDSMQTKRVGEERDARRRKAPPTPKWFEICHSVNRTPLRTLFIGNKVIYFSVSRPLYVQSHLRRAQRYISDAADVFRRRFPSTNFGNWLSAGSRGTTTWGDTIERTELACSPPGRQLSITNLFYERYNFFMSVSFVFNVSWYCGQNVLISWVLVVVVVGRSEVRLILYTGDAQHTGDKVDNGNKLPRFLHLTQEKGVFVYLQNTDAPCEKIGGSDSNLASIIAFSLTRDQRVERFLRLHDERSVWDIFSLEACSLTLVYHATLGRKCIPSRCLVSLQRS